MLIRCCCRSCCADHLKLYIDNLIDSPMARYEFDCSLRPVGIINIHIDFTLCSKYTEKLKSLVSVALYHGNYVIITANDLGLLSECDTQLKDCLEEYLYNNMLTFCQCDKSDFFDRYRSKNKHLSSFKVIAVREKETSYIHNLSMVFLSLDAIYWNSKCFLSAITTFPKNVWS